MALPPPLLASWAVVGEAGPVPSEGCSVDVLTPMRLDLCLHCWCGVGVEKTVKEEYGAGVRGQKKEPTGRSPGI